jgi:hypothetical protein
LKRILVHHYELCRYLLVDLMMLFYLHAFEWAGDPKKLRVEKTEISLFLSLSLSLSLSTEWEILQMCFHTLEALVDIVACITQHTHKERK